MTKAKPRQPEVQAVSKMAYTLAEAATAVGVSRPVMTEWVNIKGFPAFKSGKRWIIPAASLERWLDERAAAGGNVMG